MKRLLLFLVAAAALSGSALGVLEDLGAPDWRGLPGSTLQAWSLDEPVLDEQLYAPDAINQNPMGTAMLEYFPGATTGWQQEYMGRLGVVPLFGALIIEIPNFQEPNPYKDIIVQVVWAEQTPLGDPEVAAVMADGVAIEVVGELLSQVPLLPADVGTDNGGEEGLWYHSTFLIHLEPNPACEKILIGGSVYVDQVIIDTICVPEPATLSILGLGMFLIRRKK